MDYKFVNQVYLRSKGKPITIAETPRLLIRELTVEDIKVIMTPRWESSITTHSDGSTESNLAVSRKISGAGFGLATCVPDKRTEKTFSEDKLEPVFE